MKKLIKILMILFALFVLLIIGGLITLRIMFPPAKIKSMAQEYVKANFNREINYKDFSLNLIGVTINDFAMSEVSSFKEGTFVSAEKLVVKVDFDALLEKKIRIKTLGLEDFTANVIKYKNGKFNFDDFLSMGAAAPAKEEKIKEQTSDTLDLMADIVYLKNASVVYKDEGAGSSYTVRHLNVTVNDFDFTNTFKYAVSLTTDIVMPAMTISPVNLSLKGTANVANMVFKDAVVNIDDFTVSYKTAKIQLKGSINNFDNPACVLSGSLKGIDNNLLSEFASDLPPFALPEINLSFNTLSDIQGGFTKINNIKATVGKSYIITDGMVNYSKPDLVYNAKTRIAVSLSEISQIAKEMLAAFNLKGGIDGSITANSVKGQAMPAVKGEIKFNDIGASFEGKEVKNITGTLMINSLSDIRTNLIKGLFMGSAFETSVAYKQLPKKLDIDFFFHLAKFTLDDINFDALFKPAPEEAKKQEPKKTEEQKPAQTVKETPRSMPMDIKADISIDRVENNIFSTDKIILKADLKNFDNKMDRTTGVLSFSTTNGEIRDIDKLMQSSVVLKLLLTSVRIVQNAFKVLQLDKFSLGNNKITYSLIEGAYTLNNGIVNIDKSEIDSDLTTVKASGTVNLVNEKLDMKIESHLGKVGASGFKPVVIKVGGTLSDPSYKLDVVSSVTSIINIPGNVVKGTASGAGSVVKGVSDTTVKTVKDVLGIFKKKK